MKALNISKGILIASLCTFIACHKQQEPAPEAVVPEDCLVSASSRNGEIIDGEYILTYKEVQSLSGANARVASVTASLFSKYQIQQSAMHATFAGARKGVIAHLSKQQLANLESDESIESIEPDRILSMCTCLEVTEPLSVTWSIRKTGYGNGTNFTEKTAWIVDTGIDLDHPDLSIDTVRSRSFITGSTTADDENGHGTHVAGIIGALNNRVGLLGIASGVRIVSLKVLNQVGEGRLSSTVAAIAYINTNGRVGDVVNMSLGGEGTSVALEREIQAAAQKGILFSIAAGNEGKPARDFSPGRINHPNIFTVSAVDSAGTFASFSNYGNDVVDVAAYGVRIASTYRNGRYAVLSGTSMAAPHVAGLLLIRGRNIPTRGFALNDPDGQPDPIARQ
ncbi:S8 family serine peptidase [Dyadobacter sp. NIV53]|uniref:S8 family serine peptidase n=1 Tax=Dyadobacter sp. NIV53 TaxID=2861765 RepID=UPI001C88C205|nr:S8 family serine peptidase [Dyadobacter sp. NIV53]